MPAVLRLALRLWMWTDHKLDLDRNPFRLESANVVHLHDLRSKAHATKETYYLNIFKQADEDEKDRIAHQTKNSRYALAARASISRNHWRVGRDCRWAWPQRL